MGVDADDASGGVDERAARRPAGQRRRVLDAALDAPAPRATERPAPSRHEARRDAIAPGALHDGEDGLADPGFVVGPRRRGDVAGVDVEHDDVVVGIGADEAALVGPSVGEGHLGRAVAQVVGVGEHPVRRDDEPGAPAVPADGDGGGADGGERGAGGVGEVGEDGHGTPRWLVTCDLQVTLRETRRRHPDSPHWSGAPPPRSAHRSTVRRGVARRRRSPAPGRRAGRRPVGAPDRRLPARRPEALRRAGRRARRGPEHPRPAAPRARGGRRGRVDAVLGAAGPPVLRPDRRGRELGGALRLLAQWGAGPADRRAAGFHDACGSPVELRPWCPTCDRLVDDDETSDHYEV